MEHGFDPYGKSLLVQRLKKKGPAVSVLDLDNTCTGPEASQLKLHELSNRHSAVAYNTARETGMVASSASLEASRKYGYHRAPPNLGIDARTGRHVYTPPELLRRFAGHLDPLAIIGFGGNVLLRQSDRGFAPDMAHAARLGGPAFRSRMRTHFTAIDSDGDLIGALSELEDDAAFREGRTNVQPLDWRFQFNPESEEQKADLKFRIASHLVAVGERELIDFRDESKPGAPCFYVVPAHGTKEASADFMLRKALAAAGIDPAAAHLTIADDALTGLRQLPDLLPEAAATYVLPGGAPVAQHLMASSSLYGRPLAGEDLGWLLERIEPEPTRGYYRFLMPGGAPSRRFIIADEAVPGHDSADSLLAISSEGGIYTDP